MTATSKVATARTPHAGAARLHAVIRHTPDDRNFHLSPILQHIQDEGPAMLNGEPLLQVANSATAGKPKAVEIKSRTAVTKLAVHNLQSVFLNTGLQGWFWYLLCVSLTIALCCTLVFTYKQQAVLEEMANRLQSEQISPPETISGFVVPDFSVRTTESIYGNSSFSALAGGGAAFVDTP